MKTLKITAILISVFLLTLTSCKKDPGFGGQNNIKGTVTLNGAPVAFAIVYLAINAKDATTKYDASTLTDAGGNYKFSALNKGDYFVDAQYTDPVLMIKLESAGAKVTIGGKKDDVTVNLTVQ